MCLRETVSNYYIDGHMKYEGFLKFWWQIYTGEKVIETGRLPLLKPDGYIMLARSLYWFYFMERIGILKNIMNKD